MKNSYQNQKWQKKLEKKQVEQRDEAKQKLRERLNAETTTATMTSLAGIGEYEEPEYDYSKVYSGGVACNIDIEQWIEWSKLYPRNKYVKEYLRKYDIKAKEIAPENPESSKEE